MKFLSLDNYSKQEQKRIGTRNTAIFATCWGTAKVELAVTPIGRYADVERLLGKFLEGWGPLRVSSQNEIAA